MSRSFLIFVSLAACNATPPNTMALADAQAQASQLASFRTTLEARDFTAIDSAYSGGVQAWLTSTSAAHAWASGGTGLGTALDGDVQTFIGMGQASSDTDVQEAIEEGIWAVVLHASFEKVYGAMTLGTSDGWDTAFGLFGSSGATPTGLAGLAADRDTEFGFSDEATIAQAFDAGRAAVKTGAPTTDTAGAIDDTLHQVFGLSLRHSFAEGSAVISAGRPSSALTDFAVGNALWDAERDHVAPASAAIIDGELAKGQPTDVSTMNAIDFQKLVDTVDSVFNLSL